MVIVIAMLHILHDHITLRQRGEEMVGNWSTASRFSLGVCSLLSIVVILLSLSYHYVGIIWALSCHEQLMISTCIVTRSGSPPKAEIWSWTHCKASSWVQLVSFVFFQLCSLRIEMWQFLTWSMSPTFPPISSSGRQRKPRGPTLYCRETSTCQVGIQVRSEVWRFLYHITLQEFPWTSPNVSSQHERATVNVHLQGKTTDCLNSIICLNMLINIFIHRMYLVNIYWSVGWQDGRWKGHEQW